MSWASDDTPWWLWLIILGSYIKKYIIPIGIGGCLIWILIGLL